jgi:DNA-binding protein Fis
VGKTGAGKIGKRMGGERRGTEDCGMTIKQQAEIVSPASLISDAQAEKLGAQKQLTQAVFDGLPSEYRWAAVDANGIAWAYVLEPEKHKTMWGRKVGDDDAIEIGGRCEATDWQNSKIERLSDTCIDDMGSANFQKKCQQKEATVRVNRKHSHYFKDVSNVDQIDVYAVLRLFDVTDPCLQHIVKKALCAGRRGAKDWAKDVQEIADTANRLIELEGGN